MKIFRPSRSMCSLSDDEKIIPDHKYKRGPNYLETRRPSERLGVFHFARVIQSLLRSFINGKKIYSPTKLNFPRFIFLRLL